MDIIKIICLIFISPVAVFLHKNGIDLDFWINLVLYINVLFFIPIEQ